MEIEVRPCHNDTSKRMQQNWNILGEWRSMGSGTTLDSIFKVLIILWNMIVAKWY